MREAVEALRHGSLNDLKRELERVHDINRVSPHTGFSFLHFAVIGGNDPEKIKAILEKGANPNLRARSGYTALHLAALKSNPLSIDMLIDAGARVNTNENRERKTPLHLAVKNSPNPKVSLRLVARGADMDLRDAGGNTPLQLSDQRGAGGHLRAYSDERKAALQLCLLEKKGIKPTKDFPKGMSKEFMEKAFTTTLNHHYNMARPIRRSKSLSDLGKEKRLPKRGKSI